MSLDERFGRLASTEDRAWTGWRTLSGLSVLISQACLSRHLSEITDRIAKGTGRREKIS